MQSDVVVRRRHDGHHQWRCRVGSSSLFKKELEHICSVTGVLATRKCDTSSAPITQNCIVPMASLLVGRFYSSTIVLTVPQYKHYNMDNDDFDNDDGSGGALFYRIDMWVSDLEEGEVFVAKSGRAVSFSIII